MIGTALILTLIGALSTISTEISGPGGPRGGGEDPPGEDRAGDGPLLRVVYTEPSAATVYLLPRPEPYDDGPFLDAA